MEGDRACSHGSRYRSILGSGRIAIVKDEKLKSAGLDVIMRQQTGRSGWDFKKEDLDRVLVLNLTIESLSGKISGC